MRKEARGSKSGHLFCNHSCAATYNITHKTVGTRRSKLEVWLESQLRELYPNLTLLPNDKTAINSELDFYFPELKLAFELNGIFHYEPIYLRTRETGVHPEQRPQEVRSLHREGDLPVHHRQ